MVRSLHLVVVLDAGNAMPYGRIQERGSRRSLLGASREEAFATLDRGRRTRQVILGELQKRNPRLRVLQLDTGASSPVDLAGRILHDWGVCRRSFRTRFPERIAIRSNGPSGQE